MSDAQADDRAVMALSPDEADLLRMGLVRYMLHWQEHYEEDGGETHTAEELEQVMTEAGRLLWRLEQETAHLASPSFRATWPCRRSPPPGYEVPGPDADSSCRLSAMTLEGWDQGSRSHFAQPGQSLFASRRWINRITRYRRCGSRAVASG